MTIMGKCKLKGQISISMYIILPLLSKTLPFLPLFYPLLIFRNNLWKAQRPVWISNHPIRYDYYKMQINITYQRLLQLYLCFLKNNNFVCVYNLFLESSVGCFLCKSETDQNHTHVKRGLAQTQTTCDTA